MSIPQSQRLGSYSKPSFRDARLPADEPVIAGSWYIWHALLHHVQELRPVQLSEGLFPDQGQFPDDHPSLKTVIGKFVSSFSIRLSHIRCRNSASDSRGSEYRERSFDHVISSRQ
jgi:hypothetical protein